jgi:hypothetical protein
MLKLIEDERNIMTNSLVRMTLLKKNDETLIVYHEVVDKRNIFTIIFIRSCD